MGNDSGELGHNMMDHHYGMGVSGVLPGLEDTYYKGRRPGGFYIPRFRNIDNATKQKDYLRGFGYQGGASRRRGDLSLPAGKIFKDGLTIPGEYQISITCFGELLPYHENKMQLNFNKLDRHEMPTIVFDATLRDNEQALRKDGVQCGIEMLEAAGCRNISSYNEETAPGACIHEMGTARMGKDPKTSVLNKWNQIHTVKNVFVTDGACMTSSGTQNPSITYMALTARAVDFAYKALNKREL
jgi:choline dehydrogenase-like flavoprotein